MVLHVLLFRLDVNLGVEQVTLQLLLVSLQILDLELELVLHGGLLLLQRVKLGQTIDVLGLELVLVLLAKLVLA